VPGQEVERPAPQVPAENVARRRHDAADPLTAQPGALGGGDDAGAVGARQDPLRTGCLLGDVPVVAAVAGIEAELSGPSTVGEAPFPVAPDGDDRMVSAEETATIQPSCRPSVRMCPRLRRAPHRAAGRSCRSPAGSGSRGCRQPDKTVKPLVEHAWGRWRGGRMSGHIPVLRPAADSMVRSGAALTQLGPAVAGTAQPPARPDVRLGRSPHSGHRVAQPRVGPGERTREALSWRLPPRPQP
jgi:hypothetical protein